MPKVPGSKWALVLSRIAQAAQLLLAVAVATVAIVALWHARSVFAAPEVLAVHGFSMRALRHLETVRGRRG